MGILSAYFPHITGIVPFDGKESTQQKITVGKKYRYTAPGIPQYTVIRELPRRFFFTGFPVGREIFIIIIAFIGDIHQAVSGRHGRGHPISVIYIINTPGLDKAVLPGQPFVLLYAPRRLTRGTR
jgi:hypothetical protein